jgi:hypothetical protein
MDDHVMKGRRVDQMQKEAYYIIFQSETIVFDGAGNKLISCPTEDEAEEYRNQVMCNLKKMNIEKRK